MTRFWWFELLYLARNVRPATSCEPCDRIFLTGRSCVACEDSVARSTSPTRKSSRLASFYLLSAVVVCFCLVHGTHAFHMSMMSTRLGSHRKNAGMGAFKASGVANRPVSTGAAPGVTSSLISQLAVIALKLRLANENGVKCDVSGSSSGLLLRGEVGPVTVKGRGWQSELGLTCRAIEANVKSCQLDIAKIVSKRKLILTTPARGDSMIALNSVDFGNFITHPLMKPPMVQSTQTHGTQKKPSAETIQFLKHDVTIDPVTGTVIFFGSCMGEKWRFILCRGRKATGKRAVVQVMPLKEKRNLQSIAVDLTAIATDFFNNMVFELDGTFLSFQDMMVTRKGDTPSVMLALNIVVKKFPAAGLSF